MPAKKRCQHAGAPCPNAAVRIVGTCSHCSHHFCASVSRLPPLIWIAVADVSLWVNSTDYLSSMHAPSSLSASVRRLRRTGPSSSRRVPSRARWRSYHEAASVAYLSIYQSQSSSLHLISPYAQSYRRHSVPTLDHSASLQPTQRLRHHQPTPRYICLVSIGLPSSGLSC